MGMFEGVVAELRVWNLALTEDFIRDNMRCVASPKVRVALHPTYSRNGALHPNKICRPCTNPTRLCC